MAALLDDLEAMENNIYKEQIKIRIDKMLGSFTINMDPSNYRRLYRDKAFRETLHLPSVPQPSLANPAAGGGPGGTQSPQVDHYNPRGSQSLDNLAGIGRASPGQQSPMPPPQVLTAKQIQNMAAPATSMGL